MTFKLPAEPWNYNYATEEITAHDEDGLTIATTSDELTPDECVSVGALFCAAPALLAMLERLLVNWVDISDTRPRDWVENPVANHARAVPAADVLEARALVRQVRGMGDAP